METSRADDAGKGFAVVAEEAPNLASKSAEAVQGTSELIRASVDAVAVGSTLADETAERLASTVSDIKSMNSAVTGISEASERQADNISQVSDVVRNNSATSEQSAASSQELSAQAQMLNELPERFQLTCGFVTMIDPSGRETAPFVAARRLRGQFLPLFWLR